MQFAVPLLIALLMQLCRAQTDTCPANPSLKTTYDTNLVTSPSVRTLALNFRYLEYKPYEHHPGTWYREYVELSSYTDINNDGIDDIYYETLFGNPIVLKRLYIIFGSTGFVLPQNIPSVSEAFFDGTRGSIIESSGALSRCTSLDADGDKIMDLVCQEDIFCDGATNVFSRNCRRIVIFYGKEKQGFLSSYRLPASVQQDNSDFST